MAKKKAHWEKGTVFLASLNDNSCGVGQVVSKAVMESPTVAVFPWRVSCDTKLSGVPELKAEDCIVLLTVTNDALNRGRWQILGQQEPAISSYRSSNWKYQGRQWVGAEIFTSNFVNSFLKAYHGLEAWDDFADPKLLDKLLLPPHTRPKNVKLIKSN